ncbi:MAG TPA: hypothetical protein VJR05_12625, partial [Acidimicrobiia bacterium]|nr:hypothetical protein [Acidimicrobiia bacterium]
MRELTLGQVTGLVELLAGLSVEATVALPGYDPARAPVILSGAVVAEAALKALSADKVVISLHDLLDGVIAAL